MSLKGGLFYCYKIKQTPLTMGAGDTPPPKNIGKNSLSFHLKIFLFYFFIFLFLSVNDIYSFIIRFVG